MTCAEARNRLERGGLPGSTQNRDPQLGFHLATCADCRAFRAQLDQGLLAVLLASDLPVADAPAAPPDAVRREKSGAEMLPPRSAPQRLPRQARRRRVAAAGFVVVVLPLLAGGWYLGLPLYRAYHHLAAMYVPAGPIAVDVPGAGVVTAPSMVAPLDRTATPTTVPSPTATVTARATSTPRPTATPSPTPTTVPTTKPTPTPQLPAVGPVTVALLGLDARPGEGVRARSDALMLVRLDPERGDVALLSMPRDLWVAIPGYGESKVNAAFFYGAQSGANGGLSVAAQTLSAAFGIDVDYAVAIDFAAFRSVIDTLGGITVDVPKEIYDGHFPTDDYGYTVAHFLPGPQQMDGTTALTYARTRHPDSDFERIKRQQLVLLGIAARLRERGVFQNLHDTDQLTAELLPYVHTTMPPDLVLALLWNLRNIDPATVRCYAIDGSQLWETSVGGAYALVPPPGVLPGMGQNLLNGQVPETD